MSDMRTELDVARGIRDGKLPSPQLFGDNLRLFAMRVTGTGNAYRRALDEAVYRNPKTFLTEDFLERCQGLPVIVQHPEKRVLNSEEFAKRVIGSIMLPYIKGDEVWGIARIYDAEAAEAIQAMALSTSPSVVIKRNESRASETESGRPLLVEGEPYLLDHLAIVNAGVWDKGDNPNGIEITERNDAMSDESGGSKEVEFDKMLSKLDDCIGKMDAVANSLGQRMDAMDARMDAVVRSDKKREDGKRVDRDNDEFEDQPGRQPGEAKQVVADGCRRDDDAWQPDGSELREAFADAQSKADNALAEWGARAPAPLAGESFRRYRERLLRPLQKYSQVYKDVDLRNFPEVAFGEAEKAVYADAAIAATRDDLVPEGALRAVTKTLPNGSKETRFFGHPSAWMNHFIPTRRALVRLNPQGITGNR